jgi:hypothetical protein
MKPRLDDLDRCVHGRHASDTCVGCPGGWSAGNLYLTPRTRIGTTLAGEQILAPEHGRHREPDPGVPCRGFQWFGQSFASCDRCGLPYWEHTHYERIRRGANLFDLDAFELVLIMPDAAARCKAEWGSK